MPQQRTVQVGVRLAAENYFAGLAKMRADTDKTASAVEKAADKHKAAFDSIGKASLVTAGVGTAAFAAMVKASADFEQRMSQVQALSKATAGQMDKLRASAFGAGRAFCLSAKQVADAQIELTKAGVGVRDIVGGALPGALALAAAGQIDVSKATEIATTAMTQFKLSGKDVPHLADLLAAGADKSIASVESLGDSLNQSGQVAAQFGLSVEDTVGTLTAFSKAGLNGSDAGTSFKTMLTQLASPTKQAQDLLNKYNIATYDTRGNFVGITALADNLKKGLGGLSQAQRNAALSTIFGNDAIRASSVLYDLGGKKLQGFIDANNENGFAAEQARKKLDNLNGDLQILSSTVQDDLIRSGSGANLVLRDLAKGTTTLLRTVGDLPQPLIATGGALTIAAAGIGLVGTAAFVAVPKMVLFEKTMADAGYKVTPFSSSLNAGKATLTGFKGAAGAAASFLGGPWGLGLAAGGAAVSGLEAYLKSLQATSDEMRGSLKGAASGVDVLRVAAKGLGASTFGDETKSIKDFSQNVARLGALTNQGLLGNVQIASSNDLLLTRGAIQKVGESLGDLAKSNLPEAQRGFSLLAQQTDGSRTSLLTLLQNMPTYRDAIRDQLLSQGALNGSLSEGQVQSKVLAAAQLQVGAAARDGASGTSQQTQSLSELTGAGANATTSMTNLQNSLNGLGSTQLDARGTARAFEQAVDDATAAAKRNGQTLDNNTQAGRDNNAALDNIVQTAGRATAAYLKNGGTAEGAAAKIADARAQFIKVATAMTGSATKARELADRLNLIPSKVYTAVQLNGAQKSLADIASISAAMAKLVDKRIDISTYYSAVGTDAAKGAAGVSRRAAGGSITGPGPKGKDSVLAYLAPGEHVLTAREVDKMGGQAAVYAFRRGIQAYATGGAIGESDAAAAKYRTQITTYTRQLAAAKKAATAAEKTYDSIGSGKKDAARKKAAKARQDAADKKVDDLSKRLDDAKSNRQDALSTAQTLRNGREDFVSEQRRGVTDPLSYVDQLRSMSRDDSFSNTRRTAYAKAANQYEASLVKLAKQSEDAASKLGDLKSSADSMRSSIVSAIAGGFQLSGAGAVTSTGSTIFRDGIGFQTTTSGVSADAIDQYYRGGAQDASTFASDLKALASRGLNGQLLAELAGYGVAQGASIAKALLSATTGQIGSINTNYASIQGSATAAAGTVTDLNYKALIDSAQANADRITAQIATDSEKLRKLIASAFGLTGYAIGTMNATPGFHLVGERGPELLRFAGGEQVLTAANTRAMMAAARSNGSTTVRVAMPQTMNLIDADGQVIGRVRAEARDVAVKEIAADARQDSVLMRGGAA